jgi:hypothetical protein
MLKVRDNRDTNAKCRCGLVFQRVAVVVTTGAPEYYPYFCLRCDRVASS